MLRGGVRARAASNGGSRARSTTCRAIGDALRGRDARRGASARASLVVATGGLSVPKIGATPFGYRLAEQFGLARRARRAPRWCRSPSTRRSFSRATAICRACRSRPRSRARRALPREPALHPPRPLGAGDPAGLLVLGRPASRSPSTCLPGHRRAARWLARRARRDARLAHAARRAAAASASRRQWCEAHGRRPADRRARCRQGATAHRRRRSPTGRSCPSGTRATNKAEVTLGGVDTRGLSSKTMAGEAVPGLYFVGEVVDVTGWLGGYNFQWAWASGAAAGRVT